MIKNNITYKLGKEINIWKDGLAQTLTFIVTEDCNLRSYYLCFGKLIYEEQ